MSQILIAVLILVGSFQSDFVFAAASDSCDCEQLTCGPCEAESGMSFYTEKCAGGSRVKSCSRPNCVPLDPKPPGCASAQATPVTRDVASKVPAEVKPEVVAEPVGAIKVVKGTAWMESPEGSKQRVLAGQAVREKDTLVTEKGGELKIEFKDGNTLNLTESSKLKLEEYTQPESKDKKALLELIRGKVRSKVQKKYDGETSYYQIKTKSAVAGVRGTDFVVTYSESEKHVTRIETLKGEVVLKSKNLKEEVAIGAGQYASYVVQADASDVFNEEEINEFVARGYMTPVYKMSAQELKKLDWDTEVGDRKERGVAAADADAMICSAPQGKLNQCSWTCVGNPDGESRCRTDLPQVNCVRKRCNANGAWAEEHRLPASFYDSCDSKGSKVGPCDY